MSLTTTLAPDLVMATLLESLRRGAGYELLFHWQQGEFHHDFVIARPEPQGPVLVVATNCNGGIKELLVLEQPPDRWALWHWRVPDNPEFEGSLPPPLAVERTVHWFDPAEMLGADARSELRPEHRRRQRGGGWRPLDEPAD